eukprot:gene40941-49940_t
MRMLGAISTGYFHRKTTSEPTSTVERYEAVERILSEMFEKDVTPVFFQECEGLPADLSVGTLIMEEDQRDIREVYKGTYEVAQQMRTALAGEINTSNGLRAINQDLTSQVSQNTFALLDLRSIISQMQSSVGELQEGRKAADLLLKEAKAELKLTQDKLKMTEDELLEVKGDLGVALVTASAYYYELAREVALESSRQRLDTKILKVMESKFRMSSLPTFLDKLRKTRNDIVHYSRQATTIAQLLVEVNNAKLSLHKILPRHEALQGILKDACIAFDMAAVLLGVDDDDTTQDVKVEG